MTTQDKEKWMPGGDLPPGHILKGFRYRLYPNHAQAHQLRCQLGCCRWVWNHFLTARRADPRAYSTYSKMAAQLTVLKRDPDLAWLKLANAQALQQTLMDLERAWEAHRRGLRGRPKFKRKHRYPAGFRVPQGFYLDDNRLHLPKFQKDIRIVLHRPLEGEQRSVSVVLEADGQWYASFLCRVPHTPPAHPGGACGVDVGLTTFAVAADDDGHVIHFHKPKHLYLAEKKLKHLSHMHSKCEPDSRRREKARRALAKQHAKVRRQRADFLHQAARRLADAYALIGVESLNIQGMQQNHCLAKSISDAGWYTFKTYLKYKAAWQGGQVIEIETFYPSSKTCSACGYVVNQLPLSEREWLCPCCGAWHDRDINAAANLLRVALNSAP